MRIELLAKWNLSLVVGFNVLLIEQNMRVEGNYE